MKSESLVRLLAGSMVLISVALAHFASPWWLLLTCFVGLNLAQSAFTGICPAVVVFKKLGWVKDGAGCDCPPAGPSAHRPQ